MHRFVWHWSVLLLVLGIGGGAAAVERKLTRAVESGKETMVDSASAWDADCNPRPVTITIVQTPANGTVSIRNGSKTIVENPRFGTAGRCAGRTIAAKEIMYRSNPGYHGSDTVTYDIVYGTPDRKASVTVAIEVAQAAAPMAPPAAAQTSMPNAAALGAVAVGACDRLGYATRYGDVEQAKAAALQACASNGDNSCKVILSIQGNCAAFAVAGTCGPRGWANGIDRRQAEQGALDGCAAHGGNGCTVRRSVCNGED